MKIVNGYIAKDRITADFSSEDYTYTNKSGQIEGFVIEVPASGSIELDIEWWGSSATAGLQTIEVTGGGQYPCLARSIRVNGSNEANSVVVLV